jgi:hypothetical protein
MLALRLVSELSMLDEEFESERLDVWFVLTLALSELSELSRLEEEFERRLLDV